MPKMDETQESYISLTDESVLFFAAQKNTIDSDRTAIVLTALNAASYGVISEAYVEYNMNHILRDNDFRQHARDTLLRTYDFAFAFGEAYGLAPATYVGMRDNRGGASFQTIAARIPRQTVSSPRGIRPPADASSKYARSGKIRTGRARLQEKKMSIAALNNTITLLGRLFDTRQAVKPIYPDTAEKPAYHVSPVVQPLTRVSPESAGISSDAVAEFLTTLRGDETLNMHSVLLLRDGKMLAEAEFGEQDMRIWKSTFSD